MKENDTWTLDGHTFSSRFILGSGKFSLPLIEAAIKGAGAEMVTLALYQDRDHERFALPPS